MYLGDNSSERIYYAMKFWLPIGIAATVSLLVCTSFAWRYQKKLRKRFIQLANTLEEGYDFCSAQAVSTKGLVENGHLTTHAGALGQQGANHASTSRRRSI